MQPRSIEYFLYVAKENETPSSILSKLSPDARKYGIILSPDSSRGSSSSGACQYKARIIIDNEVVADNVLLGDYILPSQQFLSVENENYDNLIHKAFTEANRIGEVPVDVKERLLLRTISSQAAAYNALINKPVRETHRAAKVKKVTEALIFHLATHGVTEPTQETKSPTLEQEHKIPRSRNQPTSKPNSPDLTNGPFVPGGLINEILEFSGWNPNVGHAAAPLVSTLFNSIKTQKMPHLKKLLTAIVNGDLDGVEKLLEKDPSLLLEKLDEDDYVTALSGQKSNNATAYRTALAVEDSQMATLIRNKLFELTRNNDVANAQYREQFPDGWEADEAKRWAPVFTTLDTLTTFIRDPKPGDITCSGDPEYKLTVRGGPDVAFVLTQFRSQLDRLLDEVVTIGRHFNPNLLLKAFQIYDDHIGCDCYQPRAMLFWQQVIGTIQRRLPVNYIQAFCDGLPETEEKLQNDEPQVRSLNTRVHNSQQQSTVPNFYAFANSRLGLDYAIGGDGWMREIVWPCLWTRCVEAYVNQKQLACKDLAPQSQNRRGRSTFCSVM